MIANGDQNTLSFGHNNSPSHGLRFSRDRIVEVVIPIVILESTNTMMIGLKKNVITSLLNFKGIRHRVIHVRLNQRLNGDVEVSPNEVARRNPDSERLVFAVDIKVIVHVSTEVSTSLTFSLVTRCSVVGNLLVVPGVSSRLHAMFRVARTIIVASVVFIVFLVFLSETIDFSVVVTEREVAK